MSSQVRPSLFVVAVNISSPVLIPTMKHKVVLIILAICFIFGSEETNSTAEEKEGRDSRVFGVFNVVTFPNSACGASNGYNGTCYTSSECSAKGGTASGTCASSFGVCCVFSISCGSTSSANNTYAIVSSYSTSSGWIRYREAQVKCKCFRF